MKILTRLKLLGTALFLASSYFLASAQSLDLVSALDPAQGSPPGGGGDSWGPVISPDGRYVLFASTANNLMLATNNRPIPASFPANLNVFLHDRTTRTTTLVSVNVSGVAGGNGDSLPINISTNGRFVLFESSASDLVSSDTNNATDVFVRDLASNTTLLVSQNTNGVPANASSGISTMTLDGHFVVFSSSANDLVPGDTNKIEDVFVRDLQANTTTLVSAGAISTNLSVPVGGSSAAQITPDGRYVVFFSTATNLVSGVPPGGGDVYVRDLVAGSTTWVSSAARAALSNALQKATCVSYAPAISDDGRFVAYEASSGTYDNTGYIGLILRYDLAGGQTDLIHTNAAAISSDYESAQGLAITPDGRFVAFIANTNDTSTTCVQLWDADSGISTLVSGDPNGQVLEASSCDFPAVDPTGRYVLFQSSAPNLTTNGLSGDYHFYVRDTVAGSTVLADADTNGIGSPISPASVPTMTRDARLVAFDCPDASLVSNDRNQASDAFVRDLVAGSNELVSAHDPSLPCLTANGISQFATTSVSSDGRLVAFASVADNLAPNITNQTRNIFVRDMAGEKTFAVSVDTNGFSADGLSTDPAISPDGRYVAFSSYADNIVPGDNNNTSDVFLRDLQLGVTTLVSVNANGTGPGNTASSSPVVSANGRYVLFLSLAANLAAGTFSGENIFLRDMESAVTYSLTKSGDDGLAPAMTPDGHYTAYLEGSFGSPTSYLYVWDSQASARIYTNAYPVSVSVLALAISANGNRLAIATVSNSSTAYLGTLDLSTGNTKPVDSGAGFRWSGVRLSADGTRLAGLKTSWPVGTNQVYLYDLAAGTNVLVSHSYSSSGPGDGASDSVDISADGRLVAYRSAASNLVSGDDNGVPDIFVYDAQTAQNSLVSPSRFGNATGDNRSLLPVFSGDGRTLCFESWASDLVPGDFNFFSDVFELTFLSVVISPDQTPGQGPWISWPSSQTRTYSVQFRDGLNNPNWQDLVGTTTNRGNKTYLQDLSPPTGQRFYRVRSN